MTSKLGRKVDVSNLIQIIGKSSEMGHVVETNVFDNTRLLTVT